MIPAITKDDLVRLAQIVRDITGNQVLEKNHSMLESRIRGHLIKLGFASMDQYWIHYNENKEIENESILSLMTTHYTFFFRELTHFDELRSWLDRNSQRIKSRFVKTGQGLKIWSAACSRGHEVYSLASFVDAEFSAKYNVPFSILGSDIDGESVEYAKNGVYSLEEVNTIPHIYLTDYWRKGTGSVKDFAAFHPRLRPNLKFETVNLLNLPAGVEYSGFDVIFCRNVFIYFSEDNVKKVALGLKARLNSGGVFISGVSEPLRFPEWDLKVVGPSCYEKSLDFEPVDQVKVEAYQPVLKNVSEKNELPPQFRVLCVDDSPTIQNLIKKIFTQDKNCSGVDFAANGLEARKRLDSNSYQLVTLDIHMPVVNGIEFLQSHYKKHTDPPVLMISSVNRTDLDLATKAMTLGAFDYVEKPALNNLAKSKEEILNKARMALRLSSKSSRQKVEKDGFDFNKSISQKIVVPDASQALRVVFVDEANVESLKYVIQGQELEHRSPPTVVISTEQFDRLEQDLLDYSSRPIHPLVSSRSFLKPNEIYVVKTEVVAGEVLRALRTQSVSIQALSPHIIQLSNIFSKVRVQFLVDEKISSQSARLQQLVGFKISDITPVTSFPSLSVEFFAKIRKSAA